MSFTLCLNTSTIKPQALLDKIRLTAQAGFAGVELWINDVYEYVGQGGEVRDIEKELEEQGLIVPCMIAMRGWGEACVDDYPQQLDEAKRRMDLAARLGSPFIVATPPRQTCELELLTSRYLDLLEIGRACGVRPSFEYISFFASATSLADAWSVVETCGDSDATLVLDAFHSWNTNSTQELLRQIPAERISHYHIDDASQIIPATQQTDPDRVMPGDGAIDLKSEIQTLRDIGYAGTVSLELFNQDLWKQDPASVLRMGFERLTALLS